MNTHDIELIMTQAHVSREEAIEALINNRYDPVDAMTIEERVHNMLYLLPKYSVIS